jgi:hypothetical protein
LDFKKKKFKLKNHRGEGGVSEYSIDAKKILKRGEGGRGSECNQ